MNGNLPTRETVTGIILCGGKGSRLDGHDKPLLKLGKDRLVDHICERLENQVTEIIISCSRNVAIYEATHHRIAIDKELNQGPLAGLCEAFQLVETEWAFTTPGDVPFLSTDIISLLATDAREQGVGVPVVANARQNLCLLLNRDRMNQLVQFHAEGGQAVKHWLEAEEAKSTDLTNIEESFFNVNTEQELSIARARMAGMNTS